jgi:hypothetical protein
MAWRRERWRGIVRGDSFVGARIGVVEETSAAGEGATWPKTITDAKRIPAEIFPPSRRLKSVLVLVPIFMHVIPAIRQK